MISILFMPYDDELLFNWYSRNQNISGLTDHIFKGIFFGTPTFKPRLLSIGNLKCFLSNVKPLAIDEHEIIRRHTLAPLYIPFMPERKLDKLNQKDLNNIDLGFSGFRTFARDNGIKICPLCLNEDKDQYGEAFIHREHQVPGIIVCHKHKIYLKKINKPEYDFFDLSEIKESDLECINQNETFLDYHARIASEVYYILNTNIIGYNNRLISEKYTNKLRQYKEYRLGGSQLNWEAITKNFVDLYGEDFLKNINCNVYNNTKSWLQLIPIKNVFTNPIRHILFIIFLFGSVKNFLEYEPKAPEPFGKGPWPCLNKISSHYLENKVSECMVKNNTATKEYTGIFRCNECGFTYKRRGPEYDYSERYSYIQIEDFGHVWKEELNRLKSIGYSNLKIAKTMKCHKLTVKKHLESSAGNSIDKGLKPKLEPDNE